MENQSETKTTITLTFPYSFYWGTSTSAHQVEGNNTNNDWWRAEQAGKVQHKSGLACDSYNRYEEDFDLAKSMHNNAHRFSIEWSRIEPREGEFNEKEIEHYRNVINALRERGMEPFVTLHHFTEPVWFTDMGGWLNKKSQKYFARYAEYVIKELGDKVRFWITINEPLILSFDGYYRAKYPPFKTGLNNRRRASYNLLMAHIRAYRKIKRANPNLQVGITKNNTYFEPYKSNIPSKIFTFFIDRNWNLLFLNRIKEHQDFVGIDYYYHNTIRVKFSKPQTWFNNNENKEVSDIGWEIYPEGIYKVVKQVARYKKPIFIFENGVADAKDVKRSRFITDHLRWLHLAIGEGADVRGYFYWSLLDNFEWTEGFTQRFGLVEVDFNTQKRALRESGKLYAQICKDNELKI